jgi:type IV secretion system protein VirB8
MFNLSTIFTRFKSTNANIPETSLQDNKSVKVIRNWYEERYDRTLVQRNLLFILLLIFVTLSIVSVISAAIIINAKSFDPFVVQIDDTTGMAKIVNPVSTEILNGNEALAKYFIKKYLIARETYNPVDFDTEARKVVRLFSSSQIYWSYMSYIKNKLIDPTLMYGQNNSTFLVIKSWSKLDKNRYMVRFSINEISGDKKVLNKLALVDFQYVPMELVDADRDINPVGFQVNGYRADDDNS